MAKGCSTTIRHMWGAAVVGGMVSLWLHRNKVYFDNTKVDLNFCKKFVSSQVCAAHLSGGHNYNSEREKMVMNGWGANLRLGRAPQIKECQWLLPPEPHIKINTDGSSLGNPGNSGWGSVFQDHLGRIVLTLSKGLGLSTSYWAECCAILESMEMAVTRDWKQVWVETDSKAAIGFCIKQSAMAAEEEVGTLPSMGTMEVYVGRPPWLYKLENPDSVYFSFVKFSTGTYDVLSIGRQWLEQGEVEKPRIEIPPGRSKPVGSWSEQFAYEVGIICRKYAPLAVQNWRKVKKEFKSKVNTMQEHIMNSFDIDIHLPHVETAINKYLGQCLKEYRIKMLEMQTQSLQEGSTPMTEDEIADKVLGTKPGYVMGLGYGMDPLSSSSYNNPEVEDLRRRAEAAER
ncbi:hypothetical protein IFM89_008534 [Coptis chinensis]|uniref:RNase H type-1 domain-containing protein n=1 Tax=Coptis chinensis TaxID=261450 RepID=A0A835I061_9MAGN|nr:hypothetical protein IFM89_008534 [Coptis chinensis]